MSKIKIQRYENMIKELVAKAISEQIYDPLIKLATIHYVKLTDNKNVVKIYISCYDKTQIKKIIKKMNNASGFFRTLLAKNLNLRKAPTVVFLNDDTIDRIDEINTLLEQFKEEKDV